MKFENSVTINRPVRKVFEYVTNLNNNAKWQTDILELEMTSNGRLKIGSTYRCVNRFMGIRIETKGVITDYEVDRTCAFRITSGVVTGRSKFLFETADVSTRFTTAGELDISYFKLGKRLVTHKIKKQLKNDMLRLKRILENRKSP